MESKSTYSSSEDEIDLLALFKTIWQGKKTIIRFVMIFGLIGLFIAVFSAKEYTASVTLVPQTGGSKVSGNLGGLAAMAGINLGGGNTEGISPTLYPKIVQSIPLKKELLKTPLNFSHVTNKISYKEYYKKHEKFNLLKFIKSYTIGLPSKFLSFFKSKKVVDKEVVNNTIYRTTIEDIKLFNNLGNQLNLDVNTKEGYVKIAFSMPEALPAAQMAKKTQDLLQKAIINFKIQKAKEEFTFIEERYFELKKDFEKKQVTLASFNDRNQGLVSSRSQSRIQRLESEYNLAYTIYSELAKQLETQRIKLKENTPIFTVIDPVSVPVEKSKPKKGLVLVTWSFLGFVLSVFYIIGKKWLQELKNN